GSLRVVVRPGDVVARTRRQDLDIVLRHQPLGQQAAQLFGSAEDFAAVALNDERDLHDARADLPRPTIAVSSRSIRSSLKSASRCRCPAITAVRRLSSKARAPRSSAAYSM